MRSAFYFGPIAPNKQKEKDLNDNCILSMLPLKLLQCCANDKHQTLTP